MPPPQPDTANERPAPVSGPVVAYFFTTFPKSTETFLQREIIAMQAKGVRLHLFSFWGGGGDFLGLKVTRFNLWRLLALVWYIPRYLLSDTSVMLQMIQGLLTRPAPSWLNFWENMLGAGFAALYREELRTLKPDWVHAAWGGAPATAAWLLQRFEGYPFSTGAHAYDIYEHGGDWWLLEKLQHASFIHTSTEMGKSSLCARGLPSDRIFCIRRGLPAFPDLKPLRSLTPPLRLVCIARLVEKKGLFLQLDIYAALLQGGFAFEARIVGEGPLAEALQEGITQRGLQHCVHLTGHLSQAHIREELLRADVLLHTGIVAASGDRDGLPNVVPEAMAAGVLVISSPEAATTEAIKDHLTGLLADPRQPRQWLSALRELQEDPALAQTLQQAARAWTLNSYDAHKNADQLHTLFLESIAKGKDTRNHQPAPARRKAKPPLPTL